MGKKLPEEGNLAREIVERVCDGKRMEEIVEIAKRLLDIALNHDGLYIVTRAEIVAKICWKFGLEPPDSVQDLLV